MTEHNREHILSVIATIQDCMLIEFHSNDTSVLSDLSHLVVMDHSHVIGFANLGHSESHLKGNHRVFKVRVVEIVDSVTIVLYKNGNHIVTTTTIDTSPGTSVLGYVDTFSCEMVRGWAHVSRNSTSGIGLALISRLGRVDIGYTSRIRQDVNMYYENDLGLCGFEILMPLKCLEILDDSASIHPFSEDCIFQPLPSIAWSSASIINSAFGIK